MSWSLLFLEFFQISAYVNKYRRSLRCLWERENRITANLIMKRPFLSEDKITMAVTCMLIVVILKGAHNYSFFRPMKKWNNSEIYYTTEKVTYQKVWKQYKYLRLGGKIEKLWYIYIMKYYSATKKSNHAIWCFMEVSGEYLAISQREEDQHRIIFIVCRI